MQKVCTTCRQAKPIDAYYRQKAGKYGVRSECKVCQKAKAAAEYRAKPDRFVGYREKRRRWRADNPELYRAEMAAEYARNKDKIRARKQADREAVNRRNRIRYARDARMREYHAQWREQNRDKMR